MVFYRYIFYGATIRDSIEREQDTLGLSNVDLISVSSANDTLLIKCDWNYITSFFMRYITSFSMRYRGFYISQILVLIEKFVLSTKATKVDRL